MISLQKINLAISLVILNLLGCVSSSHYHAHKSNSAGTDIEVSADRMIIECEFITDYEGDYPEPHGFMIHILDSNKTVLTVSGGTVLAKKDCFERLKISEKIIRNGNIIFVRARGDAEAPVNMGDQIYAFPRHGKFHDNGRSLNFLGIWNDQGQCYSAFDEPDDFCTQDFK